MYLKQSDLFLGLGHNFLKETMSIAEKISLGEGEFVFREGDQARHFFILIQGRIKLCLGDPCRVVYTCKNMGEVFGCSCLIGRDIYFLGAQCGELSVMLRIDRQKMIRILENDLDNALLFYKQLAGAVGNRLMQMYQQVSEKSSLVMSG